MRLYPWVILLVCVLTAPACAGDHRHDDGVTLYGPRAGIASFYGSKRSPALTAAHKTLPFGTHVQVTNTRNGKRVVVRINDRGPFRKGRIIDVSYAAASALGMIGSGLAPVKLSIVKPPPGKRIPYSRPPTRAEE